MQGNGRCYNGKVMDAEEQDRQARSLRATATVFQPGVKWISADTALQIKDTAGSEVLQHSETSNKDFVQGITTTTTTTTTATSTAGMVTTKTTEGRGYLEEQEIPLTENNIRMAQDNERIGGASGRSDWRHQQLTAKEGLNWERFMAREGK